MYCTKTGRKRLRGSRLRCAPPPSEWSSAEKQQLLVAMRRLGINDLPALARAVPSRRPAEVVAYLERRKREGMRRCRRRDITSPLEQWLEAMDAKDAHGHLQPGMSSEVARVLELIAETEEHPDPELCDGIDFREVYDALSQIMSGENPMPVSRPTSRFLKNSFLWLTDQMQETDMSQFSTFLSRVAVPSEGMPPVGRTYERRNTTAASMPPLLQEPSMNPLNVPLELLSLDPSDFAGRPPGLQNHLQVPKESPSFEVACKSESPDSPSKSEQV